MTSGLATAIGSGFLGAAGTAKAETTSGKAQPFDPHNWESVRAQFALSREFLQFSSYVLAPHPAPVREEIKRIRDLLDEDPVTAEENFADDAHCTEIRKVLAAYIGAKQEEVALTDSTTMGLALLYSGLRLRPGQEFLTSEHDFYSTHISLRLRNERDGVPVRKIRLYDDSARTSVDEIVGRIVQGISPQTRVLSLTWVNSNNGLKLPSRQIADALKEINANRDEDDRVLLCLDAVHGLGVEDVTMSDLGCDFFVSGVHKWMFGPRGTGLIWGKSEHWPLVTPVIPSFTRAGAFGWFEDRAPDGNPGELSTPGGFHSFENRWAVPEVVRFHQAIGPARIAQRSRSQATRLKEGLSRIPGVSVATPRDPGMSAAIVCCLIDGMEPAEAVERLRADHKVIATETPYAENHLRFGPSITTTPAEVDKLIKAVARL